MRPNRLATTLLLLAAPLAGGEPERLGDLREEVHAIRAALDAESRLRDALAALDRPEAEATAGRIAALERLREDALLRLAGFASRPRWPAPPSAAPPADLVALTAGDDWAMADPPSHAAGLWQVVHRPTGLVFVRIPGGPFTMGWENGAEGDARVGLPPRRVRVVPFLLCRTECTHAAWERGGGRVRKNEWPGGARPVHGWSWVACRNWCARNGLRLPTEEEWEYACRAGTRSTWPHGDDEARLEAYAWFRGNSGGEPRPVAGLLPNAWGLFDMTGNVSEFVGAMTDRVGLVYRGGSWNATPRGCRSAKRHLGYHGGYIVRESPQVGFRPAASLPAAVGAR